MSGMDDFDKMRGTFVAPVWLETTGSLECFIKELGYKRHKAEDVRSRLIAFASIVRAALDDPENLVWFNSDPDRYDAGSYPVARTAFNNMVRMMTERGWLSVAPGQKSVDGYTMRRVVASELLNRLPEQLNFEKEKEERAWRNKLVVVKPHKSDRTRAYKRQDKQEIARMAEEVSVINHCLRNHIIDGLMEGGKPSKFVGYQRVFNGDLEHGGRIYGTGQNMGEPERLGITIDGASVVEVDISACHVAILRGQSFDPHDHVEIGDLYQEIVRELNYEGISRNHVKAVVIRIIGRGSMYSRWPPKLSIKSVPFQRMADACLKVIPELDPKGSLRSGWGWCQRMESDIVVETMWGLAKFHNIPTLSVHDAILCRARDQEKVLKSLMSTFWYRAGVYPRLVVKKPMD